jgi:predicted lipoprotein with Yx(FWY)xxD motif
MLRTLPAVFALALVAALTAAGCGGSSTSGESGAYGSPENVASTQAASGEPGAVSVAPVGDIGKVLVDAEGLTLYYFEKDKGGASACYGPCASAWPPLMTSGSPRAMGGAESAKLGTTERKDGTTQVTYAGWPLYTYAGDSKPGEDNGTDLDSFGAPWYPLHPNGKKAGD